MCVVGQWIVFFLEQILWEENSVVSLDRRNVFLSGSEFE